jgi:hypothetical protein
MTEYIDPLSFSHAADKSGKDGTLAAAIRTSGQVLYQPDPDRSGLLQAIYSDGHRENGHWKNGNFVPEIEG